MKGNRICALLLAGTMVLALASCGGKAAAPSPSPATGIPAATPAPSPVTTSAPTVPPTQTPASTQTPAPTAPANPWAKVEESTELLMIRQGLVGTADVAAISYLGYASGDLKAGFANLLEGTMMDRDWPFLHDLPDSAFVDAGGDEIYLFVPRDERASVAVNRWIMDEKNGFVGESGDVLYRSDKGYPFVLRCNVSDFMPNTQVIIVSEDGSVLDYNPGLSLRDGSVMIPGIAPSLADYTEYQPLLLSPGELPGDWACGYLADENGQVHTAGFTFGEDGTVAYALGDETGAYSVWYQGTWKYAPSSSDYAYGCVVLDMALTGNDSGKTVPDHFNGIYALSQMPGWEDTVFRASHQTGTTLTLDGAQAQEGLFELAMG